MPESLQARVLRSVERFLEDESLTEDLADWQAKPLIKWVTQKAYDLSTKEALSLPEIEERLKSLKSALLQACQGATEESSGEALIEATKKIIEERRSEEKSEAIAKLLLEEEQQALEAKQEEPLAPSQSLAQEPGSFEGMTTMVQEVARRAFDFIRHLPERQHLPEDPDNKERT
jgi:hypothetical protein